MTELRTFERTLARELQAYTEGRPSRRRARPIARPIRGLTVHLAVREHRLAPDRQFVHHSSSISRLQARIEAEQAARAEGWQVGHVIDYERQDAH